MTRILQADEIFAEVIRLIRETNDHCYLVTRHLRLWPRLEQELLAARRRGQKVTIVTRCGADDRRLGPLLRLRELAGFALVCAPRLDASLYLNDHEAIVGPDDDLDPVAPPDGLAFRVTSPRTAKQLRAAVVEENIERGASCTHFPGWFAAEEAAERRRTAGLAAHLDERGFCVLCGGRLMLDRSLAPRRIRCDACARRTAGRPLASLEVRHCHYCGHPHDDLATHPLHDRCRADLRRALDGAARGEG